MTKLRTILDMTKEGQDNSRSQFHRVRHRNVIKFDVTGIDSGSYVNEVKFRLKLRANECNASYQYLDIHRILLGWDEMTSCWNRSETGGANWTGCAPNNVYASSTISAYINRNGSASGWQEWTSTGLRDMVQCKSRIQVLTSLQESI